MLSGDPPSDSSGHAGAGAKGSSAAGGMPWEKYRVVLLAACIGNVLEWYDFAVYGGFANEFGQVFFPPCEMDIDDAALAVYRAASFSDLNAVQLSDYCRTHQPDPAGSDAVIGFQYAVVKEAGDRQAKCPIRTATYHSCCNWKEDASPPSTELEPGDCTYNPVEQDQLLKSFGTFATSRRDRLCRGVVGARHAGRLRFRGCFACQRGEGLQVCCANRAGAQQLDGRDREPNR